MKTNDKHFGEDEQDAAYLYRALAAFERDQNRKQLFEKLAAVEDRHAAIHAQLFYRHLFQLRSLESAFCRTRRWIHERKLLQTQPVWASSVLVLGRQQ